MAFADKTCRVLVGCLLVVAMAGCEKTRGVGLTGPTMSQGIAVESLTLEQRFFDDRCEVEGRVRNDNGKDVQTTLVFQAFNRSGVLIGTASAFVDFIPAGGRAHYSALFQGFRDCDRVGRVQLAQVLT